MSDKEVTDSKAGEGEIKVSAGDAKFFAVMFKYLPQKLDMDWEQFAREMGLKDGSIAKVRARQIRKKLGLDGVGAPAKTSSPKAPKPSNANKVTKPRKTGKAKQPKKALEVPADAAYGGEMAADEEDGEI
ncbi:hypothetical protein F5Y12DRAFT_745119 [Xylaria sp. FL1777]|nr:hypothetical protein F5Y12DRAFT_745119 [Xylaria sp. FL1777]